MIRFIGSVIIVSVLLSGCAASTTYFEYEDGKWMPKWKVENRGNIKTDRTKEKVDTDSKSEPIVKIELPLNKVGG